MDMSLSPFLDLEGGETHIHDSSIISTRSEERFSRNAETDL